MHDAKYVMLIKTQGRRERELSYHRLEGTRDGVIVIMERACAHGDETYTRACNVTACIRSFTCNHGGASRRRRAATRSHCGTRYVKG